MAEFYPQLDIKHIDFIKQQRLFFVATATGDGRINLSPKGLDSLFLESPNRIHWLNLTGSGNETAAHTLENPRMTMMFCSFDRQPLILRIYGKAKMIYRGESSWSDIYRNFSPHNGARQIFSIDIESVQTSCGYAIPFYQFQGERDTLSKWSEKKSTDELESYWREKNNESIDGLKTGIEDAHPRK